MSFRHILVAVVAAMFVSTILAAEQEKHVKARLFELLEKMVAKKEQEERNLVARNVVREYAGMLKRNPLIAKCNGVCGTEFPNFYMTKGRAVTQEEKECYCGCYGTGVEGCFWH